MMIALPWRLRSQVVFPFLACFHSALVEGIAISACSTENTGSSSFPSKLGPIIALSIESLTPSQIITISNLWATVATSAEDTPTPSHKGRIAGAQITHLPLPLPTAPAIKHVPAFLMSSADQLAVTTAIFRSARHRVQEGLTLRHHHLV